MTRLTTPELAARWNVTVRTLELYRRSGEGPAFVRLGPRNVYYPMSDVLAYEEANTMNRKPGWKATIKRAAGALDLLAAKAKPEARGTLESIRNDLRALLG